MEIGSKTRQSDRKISPEELKEGQNINGIFFFEKKTPAEKLKPGSCSMYKRYLI